MEKLTEEVRVGVVLQVRESNNYSHARTVALVSLSPFRCVEIHIHCSQPEDRAQRHLCARRHVQPPDQRRWEDPKRKVTDNGKRTIDVCDDEEDISWQARARIEWVDLAPKVPDWPTIEQQNKPEDEANTYHGSYDGPENEAVQWANGQSKESKGNGYFGDG